MNVSSNPKYLQILHTGRQLFWKFGYKRVSIEEICKEAGVSKMTFYKHFANKLELLKAIFDEIFEEAREKIRALEKAEFSSDEKLLMIFRMKSEGVSGISQELLKDLYANPDPGPKAVVEELTAAWMQEIIKVFESGKRDGWIRKDVNVPFLFQFVLKMGQMSSDEELQKNFAHSEDLVLEMTNLILYGIGVHKK